jgi:hypothetical protein
VSVTGADRKDVYCWHGVLLLACQDPEHTTARATPALRDNYHRETVVYYRGTGHFSVPVTDRDDPMYGGSTIHYVDACPHQHITVDAAQACGQKRTRAAADAWNKTHGIT